MDEIAGQNLRAVPTLGAPNTIHRHEQAMPSIPIIERAYQLARSGTCPTIRDLRNRLRSEGYTLVEDFIAGRSLLPELKRLCALSCAARSPGG